MSSAIAAPAAAGIPVTHRGVARSFAVVTASTAHGDEVDLASVATRRRHARPADGRGPARGDLPFADRAPAARRTSPPPSCSGRRRADQRQVVGTLADLPALALAASIGPPATLVVGQVVAVAAGARPRLRSAIPSSSARSRAGPRSSAPPSPPTSGRSASTWASAGSRIRTACIPRARRARTARRSAVAHVEASRSARRRGARRPAGRSRVPVSEVRPRTRRSRRR